MEAGGREERARKPKGYLKVSGVFLHALQVLFTSLAPSDVCPLCKFTMLPLAFKCSLAFKMLCAGLLNVHSKNNELTQPIKMHLIVQSIGKYGDR